MDYERTIKAEKKTIRNPISQEERFKWYSPVVKVDINHRFLKLD